MSRLRKIAALCACTLLVVVIVISLAPMLGHRYGRRGFQGALVERRADIGIPGISKMYAGELVNTGFLPARVNRCDFLDDTMSPGSMVAYAVQRWDQQEQRWQVLVEMNDQVFCKPYPLGIVEAKSGQHWLWPGGRLSTGVEATAARDGLGIGDRVRFVIFLDRPGDYEHSVATEPFTVDESPTSDVNFRLRH